MAKTLTAHGDAQLDTAQKQFGSASGLFGNVAADYVDTPAHADFDFGTENFTIDFFIRMASVAYIQDVLAIGQDNPPVNGFLNIAAQAYLDGSFNADKFSLYLYFGGAWHNMSWDCTLLANTWYHVAVVRNGNVFTLYINGVSKGNNNLEGSIGASNQPLMFGKGGVTAGADYYFGGWVDEIRISKGIARWTENFDVPTEAHTPDQYTKLLVHCDGDDESTTFLDDAYVPPVKDKFFLMF